MIRFVADENFNGAIVRGLLRRNVDVVRVQDVGLRAQPDLQVLEWAAESGRVVLTHDVATLIGSAYELIRSGRPMLGVIASAQSLAIGAAIDDLELVAICSDVEDWQDRIVSYRSSERLKSHAIIGESGALTRCDERILPEPSRRPPGPDTRQLDPTEAFIDGCW